MGLPSDAPKTHVGRDTPATAMDALTALEEDDVEELLALIDELYASQRTTCALVARKRRRRASSHRQELLAQIEELQVQLEAIRQRVNSFESIDATSPWSAVALCQWEQRRRVEQDNLALRSLARRQLELARRIAGVFEEQSMVVAPPTSLLLLEPGPCSPIPAPFARLLDSVCERVAARPIEITDNSAREHEARWNDAHTVLRYRISARSRYPFKLSNVVGEFWRMFHEQMPGSTLAHDEVYHASTTFQWREPFGWFEVQGPRAMRRVYTHDGGVLLVSVAVMDGTKRGEKDNLMTGLQMQETVTIRLVRTDTSNPRSPVLVESVSESEVFAIPGTHGSLHGGHTREFLERFLHFIETHAARGRGEGRQKLENRLLDATLSRGRAPSPHATS